jgi:hypothetical protein
MSSRIFDAIQTINTGNYFYSRTRGYLDVQTIVAGSQEDFQPFKGNYLNTPRFI